jgi:hypothetical protein
MYSNICQDLWTLITQHFDIDVIFEVGGWVFYGA